MSVAPGFETLPNSQESSATGGETRNELATLSPHVVLGSFTQMTRLHALGEPHTSGSATKTNQIFKSPQNQLELDEYHAAGLFGHDENDGDASNSNSFERNNENPADIKSHPAVQGGGGRKTRKKGPKTTSQPLEPKTQHMQEPTVTRVSEILASPSLAKNDTDTGFASATVITLTKTNDQNQQKPIANTTSGA